MKRANTMLCCALAALIAGCALGPKYERPPADLPAAWQGMPATGGVGAPGER